MIHRHDEFSVHLTWKQPERGSYPRVDVPGFYVTAGWANEGVADWPLDDRLLTDFEFQRIMAVLDLTLDGNTFVREGAAMLRSVADGRAKLRMMLQEQIERAQAQLEEMDR